MSKRNSVLLLEDDTNLSDTVVEFLEDEGFEVETAYSGEEAEEKCSSTLLKLRGW